MVYLDALRTAQDAPPQMAGDREGVSGSRSFFALRRERLAAFERDYLTSLLDRHRGDIAGVARESQLPRGTLYRFLKKHGLVPKTFRTS